MSKEIKLKQIVENFMVGGVVNKPAFSNLDMFKTKISTEDVNSDIRLSSLMPEDHEEGHEIDEAQLLFEKIEDALPKLQALLMRQKPSLKQTSHTFFFYCGVFV